MNSLPKTVTRQRRGCELNPGPTAPEFSTLTTRLLSHPITHQSLVCLCLSVSLLVTNVSPVKTGEPSEILFETWTFFWGGRSHVFGGSSDSSDGRAHFWA